MCLFSGVRVLFICWGSPEEIPRPLVSRSILCSYINCGEREKERERGCRRLRRFEEAASQAVRLQAPMRRVRDLHFSASAPQQRESQRESQRETRFRHPSAAPKIWGGFVSTTCIVYYRSSVPPQQRVRDLMEFLTESTKEKVSASGNRVWSWKVFWELCAP
eukprot:5662685-Amphidinium_carterae.2